MTKTWLAVAVAGAAACGGNDKDSSNTIDAPMQPVDAAIDAPMVVKPGTHFMDSASNWSVMPSGLSDGFADPSSNTSYRYWTTMDLNGDGHPDIVHTGDTAATASVWDAAGSPYWKVIFGSSTGWTATAQWEVPLATHTGGYYTISSEGTYSSWNLVDLTGDGRVDLVNTMDPATYDVWDETGSPYWKVYPNLGDSFALAPINWPVPGTGIGEGFRNTSIRGGLSGYLKYAVIDVNGDAKPDLAHTADPVNGYVWDKTGAPHWKVYLNQGNGFASVPNHWDVADNGTTYGFDWVRSAGDWETIDLDADGQLDLVQTSDPVTGKVWDSAGSPYWKVFTGKQGQFSKTAAQWSVPPSGRQYGFHSTSYSYDYEHWTLLDIDGDAKLDLVQTGDTSHASRVWDASGDPYWKVFKNLGGEFSDELWRWSIPMSGTTAGYYRVGSGSADATAWFVNDANNDGRVDLIQTADPATGYVWDAAGSPYWKVFYGAP
jgi:predicted secreted protein